MELSDITELHYITHFENIISILRNGLLSRNLAKNISHTSIANESVQERRHHKCIPSGFNIHDYVNLFFYGRNPMLYSKQELFKVIAVLRINKEVINIPGTLITNMNAACEKVSFYPSPDGLRNLEKNEIYAQNWNHEDPQEKNEHKAKISAEVLVPNCISPFFIDGIYVYNQISLDFLNSQLNLSLLKYSVELNPHLFFSK